MKEYSAVAKVMFVVSTILFCVPLVILVIPETYSSSVIPVFLGRKTDTIFYNQVSICFLIMSFGVLLGFLYLKEKNMIIFNLLVILFFFFLAEEYMLFQQPKQFFWYPTDSAPYFQRSDVMGFNLRSNLKVQSKCYHNDTIFLYDVRYSLNENGQRITSSSSLDNNSLQSVVFLGCSYTFGIGLNDEQSLPYRIQDSLKQEAKVYNFGVSGYGPNHVLAQIENNMIDSIVKQPPRAFIFSTIQDHMRRISDPDLMNYEIYSPKYAIDSKTGQLTYSGHFNDPDNLSTNRYFSKIKRSTFYSLIVRDYLLAQKIELYIAHIVKIKNLLLSRYPKAPLHLIYWDNHNDLDYTIISKLRDAGFKVHIVSHIIPDFIPNIQNYFVRFPYEFHPSAEANRQLSEYILHKIIKSEEYYEAHNKTYHDEFDSLNRKMWYPITYNRDESGCEMVESQVNCTGGRVKMAIASNGTGSVKPFKSGGIADQKYFRYGRFTASIKADIAAGSYAYMELMNQWHPKFWEHKTVGIFFVGNNLNQVIFRIENFKMNHEDPHRISKLYNLDFNASKQFHRYSIDWSGDSISFLIDGKTAFTEKTIMIDEEMNVSLSHWTASQDCKWLIDWIGRFDESKLPSTLEVDSFSYEPNEK